jgi:hypothetical protein
VASSCYRLISINKWRGKFPPVTVEKGEITWVDREPTPDPEEANAIALDQINGKLDKVLKQQDLILERLDKLQEKPKAEGSKSKKAVRFKKETPDKE